MTDDVTPRFEGLWQRVQSALILLPFVIAPVILGGWWFTGLLVVVGYIMAREWGALLQAPARDGYVLAGLVIWVLLLGGAQGAAQAMALLAVLVLATASVALWRGTRLSPLTGGLVYVALPLAAAQLFRADALGVFILGYVLVSVWAVDIFALFSGKLIGGPRLAPVISPNKTWAGMVGAMVGATIAALLTVLSVGVFGFGQLDVVALVIMAPILAVFAQGADLFESAIKRKYDMKDSGTIIPGHGGLLDRVDGLIGVLLGLLGVVAVRGGSVSQAIWVW